MSAIAYRLKSEAGQWLGFEHGEPVLVESVEEAQAWQRQVAAELIRETMLSARGWRLTVEEGQSESHSTARP